MANNNTLNRRNQAARDLAARKSKRSEKRVLAKKRAIAELNKPMRVRLGLTKH